MHRKSDVQTDLKSMASLPVKENQRSLEGTELSRRANSKPSSESRKSDSHKDAERHSKKHSTHSPEKLESRNSFVGDRLAVHSSRTVQNELSTSLQILIDLCSAFGFREEGFNREKTLIHWQICSNQCNWIKFLKYKLSAFMSFYLDNEIPECPFTEFDHPNQLAGSSLGRFIQAKKNQLKGSIGYYSFLFSILQLKKGLPKPDREYLCKAILDTKEMLTTLHPPPPSVYTDREATDLEAVRTVQEAFGYHTMTIEDLEREYVASIRANYTDSRSKYGTLGTLMEMGVILDHGVSETVFRQAVLEDDEEMMSDRVRLMLNPKFIEGVSRIYKDIYRAVRLKAQDEIADVKLVALPEALKVRVISKGPALTYFVLKPVQKYLHKILRKIPCLKLIGKKVSVEEKHLDVFLNEEGNFHSLDYQSATDLLDPRFSGVIVDAICDTVSIPDDIRSLFHKALTGHKVEGADQVWGQLMGSIVSFIVLCVANATVVRQSLEIVNQKRYNLWDCPMLINGDDGLVRCKDDFLPVWKSIAASIGLKPSVGKVYTHHEYCNINSTSFIFNKERNRFRHAPYINMGLVVGNTRAGVSRKDNKEGIFDTDLDGMTFGARHRELIRSCPYDVRLAVHELYLKYNKETLEESFVPWYVPEELGGVGLLPITVVEGDDVDDLKVITLKTSTGHLCGPTQENVAIMQYLTSDIRNKRYSVGSIPALQPVRARSIWSSVVSRTWNTSVSDVMTDKECSFLDLSCFYLCPSEVTAKLSDSHRLSKLRQNERVWASLMHKFRSSHQETDGFVFVNV